MNVMRKNVLIYTKIGFGAVLLVVFLYLLSSTGRVVKGITRAAEPPAHLVRLQVVNGSNVDGLAERAAESLAGYADRDLEIKVVDTADFGLGKVANSFIIARQQDQTAARLLAAKLGLDPSGVTFKPLEHNMRQVSVTLVVGEDYESLNWQKPLTKGRQ
jgi:hypothetical protein